MQNLLPCPPRAAWPLRTAALVLCAVAVLQVRPAAATVTLFTTGLLSQAVPAVSLTLQIGSADGQVNQVLFDATGAAATQAGADVVGIPSGGAPVTSPAGGVDLRMRAVGRGMAGQSVRVTADASGGMVCVSGGCGATVIPFSEVRWDAVRNESGAYAGLDVASGQFTGSPAQVLLDVTIPPAAQADSIEVSNVLVFRWRSSQLYPAGTYRGRVTFTASTP